MKRNISIKHQYLICCDVGRRSLGGFTEKLYAVAMRMSERAFSAVYWQSRRMIFIIFWFFFSIRSSVKLPVCELNCECSSLPVVCVCRPTIQFSFIWFHLSALYMCYYSKASPDCLSLFFNSWMPFVKWKCLVEETLFFRFSSNSSKSEPCFSHVMWIYVECIKFQCCCLCTKEEFHSENISSSLW